MANLIYFSNKKAKWKNIKGWKMSKIEYIEILRKNYNRVLLTKKETAQELNISSATVDRLRKNGVLNSRKIGGGIYFTLEEIARFIYDV